MTNLRILFFAILCVPTILFSQENDIEIIDIEEVVEEEEITEIPFAIIEKMPLYPGCTGENKSELKKCTSDNISAFIKDNLKKKKLLEKQEPNTYRLFAAFRINEEGKIENIKVRAPNDDVKKEEVIRVLKKIPTLTPGEHRGNVVATKYSLSIKFKIDENHNFSFL